MPPAVIASDVAMSTIVRLPVWTRGSRMMAQAVRDRLDAGVRAAAERVGAEEDEEQGAELILLVDEVVGAGRAWTSRAMLRDLAGARPMTPRMRMSVRDEEDEEDRRQDLHRFLHAAQVHRR